jgi:hypothetical protein
MRILNRRGAFFADFKSTGRAGYRSARRDMVRGEVTPGPERLYFLIKEQALSERGLKA